MKFECKLSGQNRRRDIKAFSLVEVLLSMGVIGVVVGAFYTALAQGNLLLTMEREDLRATQILLQKAETIRLYTWEQVTSNGFIPSTFTVTYDPLSANAGVSYTGTIAIGAAPIATPYSNDLKQVSIQLNWATGKVPRQRNLKTFVAHYGLQPYVY